MDVRPPQHLNSSCLLLHKDFATALPLKFVQLLEVSSGGGAADYLDWVMPRSSGLCGIQLD